MDSRDFWWQYHFTPVTRYGVVDLAKALFVVIVEQEGRQHEYVRSVEENAMKNEDLRFGMIYAMLENVDVFRHERLMNLLR